METTNWVLLGASTSVNVAIHYHGGVDAPFSLQRSDCDRNIVDRAEPLPVVPEAVLKPPSDVEANSALQGETSGQDGAPRGQAEGVHRLRRARDFEPGNIFRGQRTGFQLSNPIRAVHKQKFRIASRGGFEEIITVGEAFLDQTPTD